MATLLLAEHDNKALKDSTNKAMTAAKALGADVHVLVAGSGAKAVADEAAKIEGVAKVLLADAAPYEHALAEPPSPVAWKVEVRTVMTFLASFDFTVWIAFPA